jgi:hypothetical protein
MLYNSTWKRGKTIEGPTQEEIYVCPDYFALSRSEIYAHSGCPEFLKRLLDEFPWDGRHNVIQVRAQDFRRAPPDALGSNWHSDILVRLHDGNVRVAKDSKEFHLMVCSWGDVVETDFISTPMEMPDCLGEEGKTFSPMDLLNRVHASQFQFESALPGQLVEYTSADVHRMGPNFRLGKLRLMIVAFDCEQVPSGGLIVPPIRDREKGIGPKFSDYVR